MKKAADADSVDLILLINDEHLNILGIQPALWQMGSEGDFGRFQPVGAGYFGRPGLRVENLLRGIYKDTAAVHRVLEFASELCYQYLQPFIRGEWELSLLRIRLRRVI